MATLLDGRVVRDKIKKELVRGFSKIKFKPTLVIIQVGNNLASTTYIRQKIKFGEAIGVNVGLLHYSEKTTKAKLIKDIHNLNQDPEVNGIIVQLPLPPKLNPNEIISAISRDKEVDGLTNPALTPATARGVISLIDHYKIKLAGKRVLVIGRSKLVGQPLAHAFLKHDATVTVAHSQSKNLTALTLEADIIAVAAGKPKLIGAEQVKPNHIIIDVGINRQQKLLVGDVDFAKVSKVVKAISPVPGGVGPLTVASLFQNFLDLLGEL